ncbi:Hypothetical predicted protein [Olea europaea subsp. europaea]|uniref:Uncharacterized protein n=1 Tax=Olea europaea subsp. europaea TaxID=158383 RepID=A0A8S0RR33_OLEEU|nr:Hypothetical predicted protein [Olea europaea subsp. europaea]
MFSPQTLKKILPHEAPQLQKKEKQPDSHSVGHAEVEEQMKLEEAKKKGTGNSKQATISITPIRPIEPQVHVKQKYGQRIWWTVAQQRH